MSSVFTSAQPVIHHCCYITSWCHQSLLLKNTFHHYCCFTRNTPSPVTTKHTPTAAEKGEEWSDTELFNSQVLLCQTTLGEPSVPRQPNRCCIKTDVHHFSHWKSALVISRHSLSYGSSMLLLLYLRSSRSPLHSGPPPSTTASCERPLHVGES